MEIICPSCNERRQHFGKDLCVKCYQKKWYQNNKHRILQKSKKYRQLPEVKERMKEYRKTYIHSIKFKEYNKRYQEENKEILKIKSKNYRIKNREKILQYSKEYKINNKETILQQAREYYHKNKDIINEKAKLWKQKNPEYNKEYKKKYYYKNRDKILSYEIEYRKKNLLLVRDRERKNKSKPKSKQRRNLYSAERRKKDLNYKLRWYLRTRINKVLKQEKKYDKTINLIGCSINYLKNYLESQFDDEMSWSNYGLYGWHIDHVKPCVSFDLSIEGEQRKCFNYNNLQPLWAEHNLSKGCNVVVL